MAIGFDNAVYGGSNISTWAHVCSGTNRILFVGGYGDTSDNITSIKYNNVLMTQIGKSQVPSDRFVYLYGLLNPTVGSNNVVVATLGVYDFVSSSYTGASQVKLPDASHSGTQATATSITDSVTTVVDNCWTVMIAKAGGGATPTAGSGISRSAQANEIFIDSNGVVTPAGSTSLQANCGTAQNWADVMASFSPKFDLSFQVNSLRPKIFSPGIAR